MGELSRRGFLALLMGTFTSAWRRLLRPAPKPAPEPGITIRLVRTYDRTQDRFVSRMDVLYGAGAIKAKYAARIVA